MRILAVADTPEKILYDCFSPERWRSKVDLILSCGDLDYTYLEFLVSVLDVPLLYIAGNHDIAYRAHPPEGCENVDERVMRIGDLRIGGISGSMQYNAGPDAYQYTERQMRWKLRRLAYRAHRAGGLDVVISHAAPLHNLAGRHDRASESLGHTGAHLKPTGDPGYCLDATDRCHQGFRAFHDFITRRRPRYWLHGHNHLTYGWLPRQSTIDTTTVLNVYGHYELDTGEGDRGQGSGVSK